jgi:predicted transcriptional regulator
VATVIGGKVISTVNYADDVALMTKYDTVVQDMLNRLTEIGRNYGMENNVKQG